MAPVCAEVETPLPDGRLNRTALIQKQASLHIHPDVREIVGQIRRTQDAFGSYEHASLQVNFNMVPLDDALASMRLFAEQVMPHFTRGE